MTRRGGNAIATLTTATFIGLVGGWILARSHISAHRSDLFSRSAWRRFGALGWLERNAEAGSLPMLRDYLAWEQHSALRSRAKRVIATLEATPQ